jgi:hypothetical protein
MSAPIQNVYFYNPSTITSLQSQVAALQNQVGYGQTLSTNTASYLATGAYSLQNRAPIYYGTGGLKPGNVIPQSTLVDGAPLLNGGHPGYAVYGGNVKTGEDYFARSDRYINASGDTWDKDVTLYNPGSISKVLTGIVCAKMIEEGLVDPNEFVYRYYPAMSGTAQYFTSVTVNSGAAFPFIDASYSATTGAFNLATIKVSDLIHFNIGLTDDLFVLPAV